MVLYFQMKTCSSMGAGKMGSGQSLFKNPPQLIEVLWTKDISAGVKGLWTWKQRGAFLPTSPKCCIKPNCQMIQWLFLKFEILYCHKWILAVLCIQRKSLSKSTVFASKPVNWLLTDLCMHVVVHLRGNSSSLGGECWFKNWLIE